MITKPVTLWIGASPQVVVPVSRDDTVWDFAFTVRYEDSEWTIPVGASAKLVGRNAENGTFEESGTISDNIVHVTASTAITGVAGKTICELQITASSSQVSTANFILDVEGI